MKKIKSFFKKITPSLETKKLSLKKLPYPKALFTIPRLKQLKYLPHFLDHREKQIIKFLLALIAVSLLFFSIRFYTAHLKPQPASGGRYTEATIGNPQLINPILGITSDIDKDLTFLIYSGLLKYNKNQELVPDLASNYIISPDQKTYTLYLKKDVHWHDKKELTADDVIFTIKTVQNVAYKSPLFVSFKGIEIKKIDDYTLEFQLEEPFAPFLSLLALNILPKHIWETIPPEQFALAVYNTKPVGSGPYKFKSLTKDKTGFIKSYELEANENYYRRPPYLKNIEFKFYPDVKSAVLALKNKNVAGLSYLPKEFKKEIEKEKTLNILPLRLPQYTAVFFNQTKNSFLSQKNVRKALAYSLNKERLLDTALEHSGEIIHSPILPGSIGYNPEIQKYSFNPEKAAQLFKDVGFAKITRENYQNLLNSKATSTAPTSNQTSYLQKSREILEITLTTVNQSENQKVAEIVSESWKNAGVKVNLKIVSPAEIKPIIKTRDYEALLYGIITGFDPDPYPFWHSSQNQDPGLNLSVFSNREVDYVLEDARKTNDEQIRKDKYIHFQNILIEEVPALFLYNPTYTYVLPQKIKGFETTRIAQPSDRFLNIENWYLKTKKTLK